MNFTKYELEKNPKVKFDESITFAKDTFVNMSLLTNVYDINVVGEGYYDITDDKFYVEAIINGIMVVPCAVSNVDVDYPFESEMKEVYTFSKSDDDQLIEVKGQTVSLLPEILETIVLDVPLKVVAENVEYKSGKNWEVVSERSLNSEEKTIDPRLAKLKDFKFNDD